MIWTLVNPNSLFQSSTSFIYSSLSLFLFFFLLFACFWFTPSFLPFLACTFSLHFYLSTQAVTFVHLILYISCLFASIWNCFPSLLVSLPITLYSFTPYTTFPLFLSIVVSIVSCFNLYLSSGVLVSLVFPVYIFPRFFVFAFTVFPSLAMCSLLSFHPSSLSSFLHFASILPSLPQPLTISRLDRPQTSLLTFLEKGFGKIICSTGFLTGNMMKLTEFSKTGLKRSFLWLDMGIFVAEGQCVM